MFGKDKNNSRTREYSHIEIQRTYAECFDDAYKFFEESGVIFVEKPEMGRHALSIYITPDGSKPKMLTPFRYSMSRDDLVNFHFMLTHGDKEGRVKALIQTLNDVINELYSKGNTSSFVIETGRNGNISAERVVKIFASIVSRAVTYSMDGDKIENLGDLYMALGEKAGCKRFLEDVFKATEKSIPEKGNNVSVIRSLPDIKCYTCKFCKVGPTGIRTCGKVETAITGQQFDKHPDRYIDAHRKHDSGQLVSAVIDGRMTTCANYISRIKVD